MTQPKPHIRVARTPRGNRVWLCYSVTLSPRGRPSKVTQRWGWTPREAYVRWYSSWLETNGKTVTG